MTPVMPKAGVIVGDNGSFSCSALAGVLAGCAPEAVPVAVFPALVCAVKVSKEAASVLKECDFGLSTFVADKGTSWVVVASARIERSVDVVESSLLEVGCCELSGADVVNAPPVPS